MVGKQRGKWPSFGDWTTHRRKEELNFTARPWYKAVRPLANMEVIRAVNSFNSTEYMLWGLKCFFISGGGRYPLQEKFPLLPGWQAQALGGKSGHRLRFGNPCGAGTLGRMKWGGRSMLWGAENRSIQQSPEDGLGPTAPPHRLLHCIQVSLSFPQLPFSVPSMFSFS